MSNVISFAERLKQHNIDMAAKDKYDDIPRTGKPYWIQVTVEGEIIFEGHQGHWADTYFSNATRYNIEDYCSKGEGVPRFREMTEEELTKYPEAIDFQKSLIAEYGED